MNTNDAIEFFNDLDDKEQLNSFIHSGGRREKFPPRNPKKVPLADQKFLHAQDDSKGGFKFTYKAARFEEWWLLDSLGDFYEHKWISDVLRRVKGGKEASVYQCRSGVEVEASLVAAKVYRPRSLRNLKNDQQYRVGRVDLGEDGNALVKSGDVHAIQKRSNYGEGLRHQSWIAYEFKTLEFLYEAGVDVPRPYAMEKNAILMDYVGDLENSAPALCTVALELDEAKHLYDRMVFNIDLMLTHDRIHGDLSAYNILYWDGNIILIDFPQVVLPESNPASWNIFLRDVTRVCQYFSSQGVECDGRNLASDLWTSHGHKIVTEVDPRYLDAEKPEDRQAWEKQR